MRNTGLNSKLKSSLKKHTSTRWNSAYMMIKEIIENYQGIVELLNQKQSVVKKDVDVLHYITCLKKSELHELEFFLGPFKTLTDGVEGDKYETLLMVWPIYLQLNRFLAVQEHFDNTTTFVGKMKAIGRAYMEKNANDFQPTFLHKVATVLHPAMRLLVDFNSTDREEIYESMENHIASNGTESTTNQSNTGNLLTSYEIHKTNKQKYYF